MLLEISGSEPFDRAAFYSGLRGGQLFGEVERGGYFGRGPAERIHKGVHVSVRPW